MRLPTIGRQTFDMNNLNFSENQNTFNITTGGNTAALPSLIIPQNNGIVDFLSCIYFIYCVI